VPDQYINRKTLIDTIYQNMEKLNIKFHIYGPTKFKNMYPKAYKKFVNYYDLNKVFNYSKINICTHVNNKYSMYINERVSLILGSSGLLYVDNIKDLFVQNNKECIIIDQKDYLNQITQILQNYDDMYLIRYNGHQKSKSLTWSKWSDIISKYSNIVYDYT